MSTGGAWSKKPSLPQPLGYLKKLKCYKGLTICNGCGSSHFSKFLRGPGYSCMIMTCEQCNSRSMLVLGEGHCEACDSRVDCLNMEVETITPELLCQLI